MKKYFITSDIHSYFTIFYNELIKNGFDINNQDHVLIICGDLFDRGNEAKELLNFLLTLPEDRLILIRGNHEDLFEDCLNELKNKYYISRHHDSNGTLDTIAQLTDINRYDLMLHIYDYEKDIELKLKDYYELINRAIDYYELDNYIFVHG